MKNTLTLSCLMLTLGAQAQWATNGNNINNTNTGNVGIGTAGYSGTGALEDSHGYHLLRKAHWQSVTSNYGATDEMMPCSWDHLTFSEQKIGSNFAARSCSTTSTCKCPSD